MNAGHPAGGSPVGSQVGYWKFDEGYGTTANDSGPNHYNGTLSGAGLTWTNDGKFGKAVNYDNTGNYSIAVGDQSGLDMGTNSFTLSSWVYLNDTAAEVVIEKRGTSLLGYLWALNYPSAGNVSIFLNDVASPQKSYTFGSANLGINAWQQLVTVVDRVNNQAKLYINGKFIQTVSIATTTGSIDSDGSFRIGYDLGGATFNGKIDEVKVYSSALTEEEIKLDYNQGKSLVMGSAGTESDGKTPSQSASRAYCVPGDTSTCSPPIAEWKFDEMTGTTANDMSGNNRTATLTNGPTWEAKGKVGSAVNFDGTNDYVSMNRFTYGTTGLTFNAWVKTTSGDSAKSYSGNAAQNVIGDTTSGVGVGFGLTGGKIQFCNYTSAWECITGLTDANDGNWHNIVATFATDGSVVLYLDGKIDNTGTITVYGSEGIDAIGRGYSSDYFTGQIDDVKIYNYARTPAQVAWDYNRGKPVGW